jgi:cysteine desulfurase
VERGGAAPDRVYLDYAGFAPVDPRVLAVMRPFLEAGIGNPSAPHSLGSEARESLEAARAKVARLVGGSGPGVIFTSGATEANNLAIRGLVMRTGTGARHVITSAVEHISVLNACRDLEKAGAAVTLLPVDGEGRINPEEVRRALRRMPLAADAMGFDLVTVSSNDLYGPPGAGALWVRPGLKISPQILGGGQEGGYRSGTENLPALVGLGVAAELMRAEAAHGEPARLAALRDRMVDSLIGSITDCRLTGSRSARMPHHVSLVLRGAKADSVLLDLDLCGVAASSGSACAQRTGTPSHVLRAIGCAPQEMEGSLCFTMGRWSTMAEVDAVVARLPPIVARLRALALPAPR